MRRILLLALAALVTIGLGGTAPAHAAPDASTPATAQAIALPAEVREFRAEVQAILRRDLAAYRGRLSESERSRVDAIVAEVGRDLRRLERATARTARLADKGSGPRAHRAARSAAQLFDTGYAKALANLAQIQPILQPRLTLMEGLRAKLDLDAQLANYERLGTRIHAVERALRP